MYLWYTFQDTAIWKQHCASTFWLMPVWFADSATKFHTYIYQLFILYYTLHCCSNYLSNLHFELVWLAPQPETYYPVDWIFITFCRESQRKLMRFLSSNWIDLKTQVRSYIQARPLHYQVTPKSILVGENSLMVLSSLGKADSPAKLEVN